MGPIKSGLWLGLFTFSSVCALFLVHYQRAPDNSHSQKPYQTNPAPTDPEQRGILCGKEEQMLHVSVRIEEGTKWQTRSREG